MFKKLDEVEKTYEFVSQQLQAPNVADDQKKYIQLTRQLSELEKIVSVYQNFKELKKERDSLKELLATESDNEIKSMIKEELPQLNLKIDEIEKLLEIQLLPKDPLDEKNIILEMRAGAGGDEASLFVDELFRAYSLFASKNKWTVEILSTSLGNSGGLKEVIASITGDKVYSRLKFEKGVHRVQRVPKTESQGRVHTSTITVAVLPEAEAVDVKIDPNELRIDTYRSSGHGGQSVNTTDSAVRVTHVPTGTVVTCQDGKSQLSNKEQALKVLYSRLLDAEHEKAIKEASQARLAQVGTGDRSERIRTYNFPQSRITDHRIGLTIHSLSAVMGGEFDEVIVPIVTHFQAEALKSSVINDS